MFKRSLKQLNLIETFAKRLKLLSRDGEMKPLKYLKLFSECFGNIQSIKSVENSGILWRVKFTAAINPSAQLRCFIH